MNITEHEMRGLLTGKCLPGDMRVNEELPAYLVRKFAELKGAHDAHKQDVITWEKSMMAAIGEDGTGSVAKAIAELKAQRDALAAENATLPRYFSASAGAVEHWNSWADADDKLASAPETAATEAYLNSVRAEGVEILTGKLQQLIDEGVFDAKEIGVAAGAVHEGAQIAAQLRAGKDGEL